MFHSHRVNTMYKQWIRSKLKNKHKNYLQHRVHVLPCRISVQNCFWLNNTRAFPSFVLQQKMRFQDLPLKTYSSMHVYCITATLQELVHKQMYWIQMNLQRFQASNVYLTFKIFLLYYIRKYVGKNYICLVLVLYMCTLEQLKRTT